MQREAMGSHSDGNSFNKALISLGYSDLVDRQIQTHVMAGFPLPPSLGEGMISFNRDWISGRDGDELWSLQAAGKDTLNNSIHAMEGISTTPCASFTSPRLARSCSNPFGSPKTVVDSTLEGTNYSYQGLWEFNRGVSNLELSSSGVTRYSLHRRQVGSDNTSCSSNFSSSKPSGTRFFQAMQEILAEFACYALDQNGDQNRTSFASSCSVRGGSVDSLVLHGKEVESKKKHLLSLLQVVDDQYNQCLDEIHTVISAFHAVTELDPNLHARFALPTISLMYRSLRERISTHILAMGGQGDVREDDSFESSFIQKQWALQQLKKRDHQLWRPQRGLPERSVSVLRAWMFQNFLHPYPKDAEKHLLALKSGLTRSQVSNWFINARVRLWKPMIEEMYAEMNRRKPRRNEEVSNGSHRNHLSRRFTVD